VEDETALGLVWLFWIAGWVETADTLSATVVLTDLQELLSLLASADFEDDGLSLFASSTISFSLEEFVWVFVKVGLILFATGSILIGVVDCYKN
jgi:hypothetical protein